MDTLNDLNERVDAFVGTSSFDTPAAANDQAPIDVPAEVHEDIVASVDFSEVELADEFTEPQVAVTPNGLLPMEPLPIDGRLRFCRELGLKAIGASDAHVPEQVGKYVTWLPETVTTLPDFVAALHTLETRPAIWTGSGYDVVAGF